MKRLFIIILFFAFYNKGIGQVNCDANCAAGHALPLGSSSSPLEWFSLHAGVASHVDYREEEICSSGPFALVFADEFNGGRIDSTIWQQGWSNDQNGALNIAAPMNSANLFVSDGTLKLITNLDNSTNKFVCPSLQTSRQYPAGKIEVRAKIPNLPEDRDIDAAPLWLRTHLDYTQANTTTYEDTTYFVNEIDIEFMKNSLSYGTYTLHSTNANRVTYSDGAVLGCTNGGSFTDNNWHTYDIVWDMYTVQWFVDGQLVDELARVYAPDFYCAATAISTCYSLSAGPYYIDHQFPLFANMAFFLSGLGSIKNSENGTVFETYIDTVTMEIDYVRYYRKITCDKDLVLPPANQPVDGGFRSAGGIGCDGSGGDQVPPTLDNQTPSVITAGTITVGQSDGSVPYIIRRDDYDINTRQDLDLYATEAITLEPGFETDFLYLDYMYHNYPCPLSKPNPNIYCPSLLMPTDDVPCCRLAGLINQYYCGNTNVPDEFTANIISCPPMDKTNYLQVSSPNDPPKKSVMTDLSFNINLYPNPATDQCTVKFTIPDDADVTIILTDVTGRQVGTLDHSYHMQGTSSVPFSTSIYAPGAYFVRFSDGTHISTQRLTISQGN